MATNTTNYNLVKPAYADTADIADINGNMDIIDGQMKTNANGVSANATSLGKTEAGLAIIVTADTCPVSVPAGGYAYIKNNTHGLTEGLYRNKTGSAFPTSGGTANSTVFESVSSGGLNTLKSNTDTLITNLKSRTLLSDGTPSASTAYNLSDSVLNYEYIEIIFVKYGGGGGAFVNRIIHHDSLAVGTQESLSFSTYNNSSYNFYAECGFSQNNRFNISTYRCTGWTMSQLFVVGIGKRS